MVAQYEEQDQGQGSRRKSTSGAKAPHSIAHDLWGVLLFALALILMLSLVSFRSSDIAYQVHGQNDISNWIGPGGALIADIFFTLFGLQAFFFPIFLAALSLSFFFRTNYSHSLWRWVGFGLGFLSMATLLAQATLVQRFLPFPIGGLLGALLAEVAVRYVSPIGTCIISATGVLIGGILGFRWSPGHQLANAPSFPSERVSSWFSEVKLWFRKKDKGVVEPAPAQEMQKKELFSLETKKTSFAPPSAKEANPREGSDWQIGTLPVLSSNSSFGPGPFEGSLQIVERNAASSKNFVEMAEKEQRSGNSKEYVLPPLKLLDYDAPLVLPIDENLMRSQAAKLEKTFSQFGILGHVREIRPGPVVTCFEFVPAPGIKLSRIAALADDIAMAMEAVHVRVVAPIPGKGAVGIEIPNENRETVFLKEIVADPNYRKAEHRLCMAVGKTIEGKAYFLNLADMPHVLMAGTTGSGKSVSVNAMICSILFRATPDEVRFLMIDPKMLELSIYEGIPHLLLPPIIDSKKAAASLRWAVAQMEDRYQRMNEVGVRDIYGYNAKIEAAAQEGTALKRSEGAPHEKLPFIVIVVDEYADLMAVAGKDIEGYIMRLAQKARACGIHVMLATQRPSVDVVTGVIKANFPVRMSFRLASTHDSKTIINRSGAEKLLGKGDMLIIPPGTSDVIRVHGAYISEKELMRVIDFWKAQATPEYDMSIVAQTEEFSGDFVDDGEGDEKFQEAIEIVRRTQKCSTSWLQRQLGVGYNRAARLVERMEQEGIVGPIQNAKGDREIFG